ncbi:prepilin peptidase [Sphingomonas sp.]|uniref:A24 family peptidase n=1 Tax=Sphingomonas sp. TaxID=28214 RepID=UPI0035BBD9D8
MNLSFSTAMLAILGLLLLSAGIEDVRTREIANRKNAAIALLAPVWWWAAGVGFWPGVAMQIGVAMVALAAFAVAFRFGWMGGGDVKLIAALALWLPVGSLAWMLIVMSMIGGVLTAVMLAEHGFARREGVIEVPYGVAIVVAALLTLREPILNQFP